MPTSLNDLPEQVRKFAPKKVRNVGSFHPARTALRAAINELEAAKARRNELLQEQARELDLALRADLSLAEIAVQESTQKVASAAIDLLTAAAFTQANALEAAWNNVWRHYDRLSALADCQVRYAEGFHRIKLPAEIVKLMEAIAALDRRSFPGGHNEVAVRAGKLWCRWFEALTTNAEAEPIFEREGYDRH